MHLVCKPARSWPRQRYLKAKLALIKMPGVQGTIAVENQEKGGNLKCIREQLQRLLIPTSIAIRARLAPGLYKAKGHAPPPKKS